MAYRTTEAEVKEIIDTQLTEEQVAPFLKAANMLVTKLVASDSSATDEMMAEVEKWLAAHFIAIRDPRTMSERIGSAGVVHQSSPMSFGQGLRFTSYGQQAIALDFTGNLSRAGGVKASLKVLG